MIKPYEENDGKNIMRIKGNPNIANVRVFMIGIRNAKQSPLTLDDDGLTKCAEIWTTSGCYNINAHFIIMVKPRISIPIRIWQPV